MKNLLFFIYSIIIINMNVNGFTFNKRDTSFLIINKKFPDCTKCKYYIKQEADDVEGKCKLFHYYIDVNNTEKIIYRHVSVVKSWDCIDGLYYSEKNV